MQHLIGFFFQKKRFTIFLASLFLLFGVNAYKNIAKEGAPQVKVPYVFVSIFAEGFAPQDSEKMILKPLEKELAKIQGVKNVTTYAYVNMASAVVEFDAGVDSVFAMQEVREKTDTAKVEFPQEVEEPVISEVDLSAQPVLNVALLSKDVGNVMKIARDLKSEIELIEEVLKVEIKGELIEAVEVQISSQALHQFGVSVEDILKIKNNNKLISSGMIRSDSGEFLVNVPSLVKDVGEIANLPISLKENVVVKLKDIAKIVPTYKERETIAKINGQDAVVLEVAKRSGTNIINTIAKVKNVVDGYAKNYVGDGVEILYMRDTSQKIKDSLTNLQNNIALAVLIVFIMVMNLVGFRQAVLIGISVPLSFFVSIWIFYLFGVSLNIVVLFGLVLSVGIIVDASSVIVEYANQQMKSGISVSRAYLNSARRMLVPVFVSTLTVLIVSAPLLAFPGIIGGFMKYLPLTLIIVLTTSLFVALFIVPVFGSVFDKPSKDKEEDYSQKPIEEILKMKGLVGFYARAVKKSVEKPWKMMCLLFVIIFVIISCYVKFNRGVEFFPNIETNYIRAFVRGVGNISLQEKQEAMEKLAKKVVEKVGREIDVYYTVAGGTGGNSENIPKDAIGILDIQLVDWQSRRKAKEVIEELRHSVGGEGYIVNFDKEKDGPPQSTDLYYELFAESTEKLQSAINEMKGILEEKPFLQNLEDTRPPIRMEYKMTIDKYLAMKYGIDVATISSYIKLATNGVIIDKFSQNHLDEKTEIILRYKEEERNVAQIMNSFIIKKGKTVPIANFLSIDSGEELVEIVRKNGLPTIAIKANIQDSIVDGFGNEIAVVKSVEKEKIVEEMKKIAIKHDVVFYAGGTDEDQRETMAFLKNAFIIALTVVFLVFLIQFDSFGYSIIIMSSVFLSIVGVLLGFLISGEPLSIVMCGIGVISLAGIVVSNNLIYIDFFKTISASDDISIKEGLIRSAVLRARPILLTSGTTVVGLIPAMFKIGIDFATGVVTIDSPTSQWWSQLSSSIAGGLAFATLLTLFFTPTKVLLYLKFKRYVSGFKGSNLLALLCRSCKLRWKKK